MSAFFLFLLIALAVLVLALYTPCFCEACRLRRYLIYREREFLGRKVK